MRTSSLAFLVVLLMASAGLAQNGSQTAEKPSVGSEGLGVAKPVAGESVKRVRLAETPSAHRFWDRENAWLFTGVGASRALDYASTRNMLRRGREEELLPDDVVNNTAAFVAVEAGGALTSVALSYVLHRTGHHKLERWLSIGHIGVATGGAIRNYALPTRR